MFLTPHYEVVSNMFVTVLLIEMRRTTPVNDLEVTDPTVRISVADRLKKWPPSGTTTIKVSRLKTCLLNSG